MSINKFMSKIGRGARTNLFEIAIDKLGEDVKFFCNSIQAPGRNITSNQLKIYNLTIPIAGETTYPEVTMNVINDQKFTVRNQLENWMSQIREKSSVNGFNGFNYMLDVDIYMFDELEAPYWQYKIKNCFPVDLSPIDLNWNTSDTIQEYTVTFTFTHFDSKSASKNDLGGLGQFGNVIGNKIKNLKPF